MTTNLSITSRNQGQIFGSKPSMEEFERQLEADPSFKAYTKICTILAAIGSRLSALNHAVKNLPATVQKQHLAR